MKQTHDPFQGDELGCVTEFSNMPHTAPKPFVFVLMPFDPTFDDVYRLGIQPACKEAGAYCERVDEQVYEGSILLRIYNQISKSDIVVADMTGKNPNVFYETGYAHALGKRTILVTKQADDIPFDLKHYVHIIYNGKINELKMHLKKRIKYYIDHPSKLPHCDSTSLDVYINKVNVAKTPQITTTGIIYSPNNHKSIRLNIYLSIDINNTGETSIDLSSYVFSILLPSSMKAVSSKGNTIYLPDGNTMISRGSKGTLFPKAWYSDEIDISYYHDDITTLGLFHCKLQVFAETGMRETPFVISVQAKPAPVQAKPPVPRT